MTLTTKVAKAVSSGVYHDALGLPCQDNVGEYRNEKYSAVVLCDGCGSVSNSEKASGFITSYLPKYLCDNFDRLHDLSNNTLTTTVLGEMKHKANVDGISLDTTMLAVVSDGKKELILHIGDGLIVGEKDGKCDVISLPENGDEDNVTFFLSSEDAKEHIRITRESNDAYFLTSDGISHLIYSGGKVLPAVPIMLNWLRNNDEQAVNNKCLSEIERLFKQRTNDDISLIMMCK